jgi:hypothetical protein
LTGKARFPEVPLGGSQFAAAWRGRQRHQPDEPPPRAHNDHFFAAHRSLQEPGKVRLGFMNVHFNGHD